MHDTMKKVTEEIDSAKLAAQSDVKVATVSESDDTSDSDSSQVSVSQGMTTKI